MAFCSFDDSAALFDATPVENMFISEYMLRAPGDFVKVYLYGLMLCYHQSERMSLASMARDLDVTQEDVERAYRYWEREGLVRRTGDHPVRYTYYNLKQITLTRAQTPSEQLYNRSFVEEVQRVLSGRELRKAEMDMIFDWIDVYELPEEVIVLLLQLEMEKSGGRVSIAIADKVAKEWAQSGICTVEDVEKIVILGRERETNLRKLLRRMGQSRAPSYDEKEMYNKWIEEWGFTYNQIQDACKATTSGTPTMAYLDGILRRLYQTGVRETLSEQNEKLRFARDVFSALGRTGVTPSDEDQKKIDSWKRDGFSRNLIMMAAQEVHERSMSGNLEDVADKLQTWKENNCLSEEAVNAGRARAKALNDQLKQIYKVIDSQKRVNQRDRDLLSKWMGEMGMSMDMVLLAAQYSRSSGISMDIVDQILCEWHAAGITTIAAAQAYRNSHAHGMQAGAQPVRTQDTLLRYTPEERRKTYSAALVDFDEEDS